MLNNDTREEILKKTDENIRILEPMRLKKYGTHDGSITYEIKSRHGVDVTYTIFSDDSCEHNMKYIIDLGTKRVEKNILHDDYQEGFYTFMRDYIKFIENII